MASLGWKHLTDDDKATIARGVRDGVAHGGPFHAEIYPADRCNIDCFFCSTAAIRGNDELPLSRIEELMSELREAGTRSVRLPGGGGLGGGRGGGGGGGGGGGSRSSIARRRTCCGRSRRRSCRSRTSPRTRCSSATRSRNSSSTAATRSPSASTRPTRSRTRR